MARAPSKGFNSPEARMESFWLPPDAVGNGLAAESWAEIIVVSHAHGEELLAAFGRAGVPARMASRPGLGDQDAHVWVDPAHYAAAENVLLHEMSRRDQ